MAADVKHNMFPAELSDRNVNVKVCLLHLEGRMQDMYLKCIDSAAAASANFLCDMRASHREVFPLFLLHVPDIHTLTLKSSYILSLSSLITTCKP